MSKAFDTLLETIDQLSSMNPDEQHAYMDNILKDTDSVWKDVFDIGKILAEEDYTHTRMCV